MRIDPFIPKWTLKEASVKGRGREERERDEASGFRLRRQRDRQVELLV